MFQTMTDNKIEEHLKAATESEQRRIERYAAAEASKALQLEKQKVQFEAKRILVRPPPPPLPCTVFLLRLCPPTCWATGHRISRLMRL